MYPGPIPVILLLSLDFLKMHFMKLFALVFELIPYSQSMPPPKEIPLSKMATPSS